jgi:hypothetical protein
MLFFNTDKVPANAKPIKVDSGNSGLFLVKEYEQYDDPEGINDWSEPAQLFYSHYTLHSFSKCLEDMGMKPFKGRVVSSSNWMNSYELAVEYQGNIAVVINWVFLDSQYAPSGIYRTEIARAIQSSVELRAEWSHPEEEEPDWAVLDTQGATLEEGE